MENRVESMNINIIEENEEQSPKKFNKQKIIALVASGLILIILTIIFLVGYFQFGWFQKIQDNIFENSYHENQVLLFNEFKTISTEITTGNGKEVVDQNIITDFLVVINSKSKLNYFGEIDNLYNATLVILKTTTNDKVVGGLNLLDNKEAEKSIKNPEKVEHPIAKFSFYENGTLLDIYMSNDTNQFYASSMKDLIEQIIPKISKKVYNKTENDVEYTYEEDKKDSRRKTILEKHHKKEFVDKYSKIAFKGSRINKRIKRKIKNNKINQITSESELNLISEKTKDKDNFFDIGLDGYTVKVNSDLNIVENKDDKELKKKIDLVSRKLHYEESQKLLEKLANDEMKEILDLIKNIENQKNTNENEIRKLANSVTQTYNIISINILGKKVDFKYIVSYESGKAEHFFEASIGSNSIRLSKTSMTITGNKKGSISAPLCAIPFTLGIPLVFQLKAKGDYNVNFTFKTNYSKTGNLITVSGSVNAYLDGSLSSSAAFISLSVGVEGRVIGLSGSKTADIATRKITGTLTASVGPVKVYVDVKLVKKDYHKVLYESGYISKKF